MDFGPSQKKWDGKFCGYQSFLASKCDDKVCSYCEHCQSFHRKWFRIHALCFEIASSAALYELDVLTSAADNLKHNSDSREYTNLSCKSIE